MWRAYDRSLQRQVACKVLSDSIGRNLAAERRFRREAHHIASLSHPNIVLVYDVGTEDDYPYIVMQYVEGASLRHVLASERVLPVDVTAALAVDVLAGLGHAHSRGVVHRDVKPANLLLEFGGDTKVADFGISKSFNAVSAITVEGAFVGTRAYASPEQLAGNEVGPASDLYSLGCVLFECLTGAPPRTGEQTDHRGMYQSLADPPSLEDLPSGTPGGLADAIVRSLSHDPSDRFTSAEDMQEAFVTSASHDSLRQFALPHFSIADANGIERTVSEDTPVAKNGLAQARHFPAEPMAPRRRTSIVAIAVVLLLLFGVILTAVFVLSGRGNGKPTASKSVLPSGAFLRPGHSIQSPNGRFKLAMQSDGNLVEYALPGKVVQWQSGTSGNFNAYVVMQPDGDLVVYPPGKTAPAPGDLTQALWSSGTFGHSGASAALLDRGEFVIRNGGTNAVLWRAPGPSTTKLTRHAVQLGVEA